MRTTRSILLALTFGSCPVLAATESSSQFDLLATFGSLLFVIALILGLAWIMKRMRIPALGREKDFAVIRQIPLGARERLMVVKAGDEQFVIGSTPHSIQLISKLDTPLKDHSDNSSTTSVSASFAKQLNQLMKKNEKN
ncbi:flagellar biosynthetic protein FliO [Vibrio sp.]|uniref:Flagellar protein n=1 Tax=Vibrio viridaestus TaxID=2487322 RepID=A0A3N9TIS9_9VIBR|nr:flagellar biosynthetic protein FliO [Vibrio viridaestus]MDC0611036.1 flagellar biosynthetic protein FliO [Vibrio sp.]RQW64111.1 flagellar biosynthetic protein FliO [Vibrio viridaestus]